MKSTNANDGTLTLKVSFEVGSNLDMNNVLTQNRVSQAMPQMPQAVKNYGVSVKKALAFPLLIISIKSPHVLRQQLPLERDDQRQRRDRPYRV
jgi:HAE1 family hydrophobic/amphiphilic exporter-1